MEKTQELGMLKTALSRLRLVALSEGISYLLLLGIAMPLKYLYDRPEAVRITGMLHGVLFVLLVVALLQAQRSRQWSARFSLTVLVSSIIPLGAFWMDRRLKGLEQHQ